MDAQTIDLWARNLARRDHTLTADEIAVLSGAVSEVVAFDADRDIVREQQLAESSNLLLEGWACRYVTLADGRRQIVAIHLPGDMVDLHSFPLKVMDHSVATLTPCRVAMLPHLRLKRVTETEPHLTRLLWMSTMIDAAMHRQWLAGAGARSSLGHAAHLICELYVRLGVVGLTKGARFPLPLTQVELADALGISPVHANRMVQDLKAQKLIAWHGKEAEILDWERLQQVAQWDPTYLNLEDIPR
mgnify:CR=1 FL=1